MKATIVLKNGVTFEREDVKVKSLRDSIEKVLKDGQLKPPRFGYNERADMMLNIDEIAAIYGEDE